MPKENRKVSHTNKLSILPEGELTKVDQWLVNREVSTKKIAGYLLTEHGVKVSAGALRQRRKKLEDEKAVLKQPPTEQVIEAEVVEETREIAEKEEKVQALAKASYETMKTRLLSVLDLNPENVEGDTRGLLATLKRQIQSFLRRAEEFYQNIDYLGYMNYAINVQQMRVAKGLETELGMPVTLKNVTDDIKLLSDLIKTAVELHQSLGLAPQMLAQFVNNGTVNIQNNQLNVIGQGPNVSQRQKDLERLKSAASSMTRKKAEEMKRKFLQKYRSTPNEAIT